MFFSLGCTDKKKENGKKIQEKADSHKIEISNIKKMNISEDEKKKMIKQIEDRFASEIVEIRNR